MSKYCLFYCKRDNFCPRGLLFPSTNLYNEPSHDHVMSLFKILKDIDHPEFEQSVHELLDMSDSSPAANPYYRNQNNWYRFDVETGESTPVEENPANPIPQWYEKSFLLEQMDGSQFVYGVKQRFISGKALLTLESIDGQPATIVDSIFTSW